MPCVYLFFLEFARELHIIALRREYLQDMQTHLYSSITHVPETQKHTRLEPLKQPLAGSSRNLRQTFSTSHTREVTLKNYSKNNLDIWCSTIKTHLLLCLQTIQCSKAMNKFTLLSNILQLKY